MFVVLALLSFVLPSAGSIDVEDCAIRSGFDNEVLPIERRSDLSFEQFEKEFAAPGIPVIVEGGAATWAAAQESAWSPASLAEKCPDAPLTKLCEGRDSHGVRYEDPGAMGEKWASLRRADIGELGISTIGELVSFQLKEEATAAKTGVPTENTRLLYLHDWSIHRMCSSLKDDLRAPKYFPYDVSFSLEDEFPPYEEYCGPQWPSLFIGPSGSRSALHTDSGATRFWMAVLHGNKTWRVTHAEDAKYLYGTEDEDGYAGFFKVSLFDPNFEEYPLLRKAQVYEGNVGPGDIIFIPELTPHEVENAGGFTVAVAYNYVDRYNAHYKERSVFGKISRRVARLQRALDRSTQEDYPQIAQMRMLAGGMSAAVLFYERLPPISPGEDTSTRDDMLVEMQSKLQTFSKLLRIVENDKELMRERIGSLLSKVKKARTWLAASGLSWIEAPPADREETFDEFFERHSVLPDIDLDL